MNATRTARFLLYPLLAVGLSFSGAPVAASADVAGKPQTEASVKSAPQSTGCTAVKSSQADSSARSQEDSREQFKLGRLLAKSLSGGRWISHSPRSAHRGDPTGEPTPVALRDRLQI